MKKRGSLVASCAWLLVGVCSVARAQPSTAGTYKAGPSTVKVDVSTWGDDCGTRPKSYTDNEQPKVEVRMQGAHLVLAYPDRSLRTDACWSENPTVRPAGATASDGRWRSECRTPDGEAKRERGVYTLTSSGPDVLELVDDSDYNWQLNDSRCVAKVRTTQRLTRVGSAGAAASTGCTPGPLARMRLRPSEPRIPPGGKVCFEVRGFDAAGCALPSVPSGVSFSLGKASTRASVTSNCFRAPSSGEGRFEVIATAGAVHESADVLVASNDLSDITARRDEGDKPEDEEAGESNTSAFGIDAAVKDSPLALAFTLAAALLGIAGVAGFFVLRRRAPPSRESRITPTPAPRKRPTTSAGGPPLICPRCRQGYPPGTKRCAKDGETPIPYATFMQHALAAPTPTCPQCGAQLAPGATFCGSCGTRVDT